MNNLRIILDTNVLLVSISSRSHAHWIFQKLLNGEFEKRVTKVSESERGKTAR